MDSSMKYFINRDNSQFNKNYMSIPRNLCVFPYFYLEFTKMFSYFLNYLGVHFFINMRQFIVINIPSYCTILGVYVAVSYAYIILIVSKTMGYHFFVYIFLSYKFNFEALAAFICIFTYMSCVCVLALLTFYYTCF